jgi:V/A-type H+-transporting ATPase subunit K
MKEKVFKVIVGVSLILGILVTTCEATSTSKSTKTENTVTEEMVQTMVDQKVNEAVQGAVAEIQTNTSTENTESEKANGVGLIAAAIATGLACIGAGIAVAVVASSAVGAISENPSLLGKTVIFAGLAEGIAIYGLIISIMILNKI